MIGKKSNGVLGLKHRVIYGLLFFAIILFTLLIYLAISEKSKNTNPEFNNPELYTNPGTENYSTISDLDKLIEAGAPEEAVLDLKRLIYDYQKKKDEHFIDVKSIKYSFEKLPSPDPNFTGIKKYIYAFKARSSVDDKDYFYRIIQTDNSGFTFEIFSNNDFSNRLYFYDSTVDVPEDGEYF